MSRFIKSAALIALLLGAAPVALAQKTVGPKMVPREAKISYGDLDLSQPAGVQIALKRLDVATNRVCEQRPSDLEVITLRQYNACRAAAGLQAIHQIGSVDLAAAFERTSMAQAVLQASR